MWLPIKLGAVAVAIGILISPTPSAAVCSVLDPTPCPTYFVPCSVFDRQPCTPDPQVPFPFPQTLQLTIETRNARSSTVDGHDEAPAKLDTITEMFAALRACWAPPDPGAARAGTQMTVQVSFRRNGTILGRPRVTYASRNISPDVRKTYLNAMTAMIDRCAPLPFTRALGGAMAGRPVAIRVVEDRDLRASRGPAQP